MLFCWQKIRSSTQSYHFKLLTRQSTGWAALSLPFKPKTAFTHQGSPCVICRYMTRLCHLADALPLFWRECRPKTLWRFQAQSCITTKEPSFVKLEPSHCPAKPGRNSLSCPHINVRKFVGQSSHKLLFSIWIWNRTYDCHPEFVSPSVVFLHGHISH